MDKQGALYFKLLTGVFLLLLLSYGLPRLRQGEPAYELRGTQICEVGDGMTVSGFVVRQEHLLFAPEQPDFLPAEGQWVSGGQAVALLTHGRLTAPRSGYLSYITDGYEEVLTPAFVMGCKEEDLQALLPRSLPREAVGRLITGQEWYYAVPGSFPEIEMGSTLTLIIEGQSCEAQVLRTRELLLLKSTDYCHRITDLRWVQAVVQTGSFSAIPLPGKALYWEDGDSYVYLLQGAQVRRRTVQVLRIDGDTLWISPEDLPEGARVILTEIELTDGMVLK